ncbi:MAG: hypothetical protein U1F61_03690 [Opitutaceae bacterium]
MSAVAVLLAWVLIAGVQEVRGDPPVEFVRNLERDVSTAEFEALARISSQPQQWPRQSYRGDSIPKAYLPFRPIRVETGLGRDYVYLYERDTAHAYLVIATTPKNQTIHVIENLRGRETRRMVWVKDPAAYRRLNPAGRLISIIGWPLRGGTEWIVTPGRLLQIQRPGRGATDDELEREVPLTPREMDRFTQTIEALRKARKGVAYRAANVVDGVLFRFRYSEDGSFADDDIILENIWHPDFAEIFALLLEHTKDPWLDRTRTGLQEPEVELVPQSMTTRAHDVAQGIVVPP